MQKPERGKHMSFLRFLMHELINMWLKPDNIFASFCCQKCIISSEMQKPERGKHVILEFSDA